MTGTLPIHAVASLPDYIQKILEEKRAWSTDPVLASDDTWFRGVRNAKWGLVPGAYRRAACDEDSLFHMFCSQVPSYVSHGPVDDWEWYYLMQHYGLPTRLLDWTESALAALYFALEEVEAGDEPCVWMMAPGRLNAIAHDLTETMVIVPGSDAVKTWLPPTCGLEKKTTSVPGPSDLKTNQNPIAVFPRRHNPRIVAQRGTFTVHGTATEPIEWHFTSHGDGRVVGLARFEIEPKSTTTLQDELRTLGVDRTALFPEAESVARDLKRLYGVK